MTASGATNTTENDIPYKKDAKHDHDGMIATCCHSFSSGKGLSLIVSSVPVTPEGKAKGAAAAKAAVDEMMKMGAKVEEKKFGAITCSTMLLTGDMARFSGTSCGAEKGPPQNSGRM